MNIIILNMFISDKEEINLLKKNFLAVYGMEFVNASRVLKAKYKRNKNNKDGMTLAERIKNGRYGSGVSNPFVLISLARTIMWEKLEDTKGVIRSRILKKDRQHIGQKKKDRQHIGQKKKAGQHIGQKKKDRQHIGQKKKDKKTNNDLQNIIQKTNGRVTLTHWKPRVNSGAPDGGVPTPYVASVVLFLLQKCRYPI